MRQLAAERDSLTEKELGRVRECEEQIGYRFKEPSFLVQALTHSSIKTEDNPSNERLEFLGDSVLGLVMTEFLYSYFQDQDEGELTQIKSVVVSTSILAQESERLKLSASVVQIHQSPPNIMPNYFCILLHYRDKYKVRMYSGHPYPWYQASRIIDSPEDIDWAFEEFIKGVKKHKGDTERYSFYHHFPKEEK